MGDNGSRLQGWRQVELPGGCGMPSIVELSDAVRIRKLRKGLTYGQSLGCSGNLYEYLRGD